MLRLRNITLAPDRDGRESLTRAAAKELGVSPAEVLALRILRRSIDARKKDAVRLVYTLDIELNDEEGYLSRRKNAPVAPEEEAYRLPEPARLPLDPPAVVGFGPAGIFTALALAEQGLKPIVLERGLDVDARSKKVEIFRTTGILDPECNVQFGEGGAGTFSDGKLNTGVSGSAVSWVLRRFADFGAGESVTWDAMPHVGTDVLKKVVRNIREHIISLGGEVRFGTKMTGLEIHEGVLRGLRAESSSGLSALPCSALFLATGHSARDTLDMLWKTGILMEPKPFSMGFRIEHLQEDVDRAQFGSYAGNKALGAANYKLSVHLPNGVGVYTFCMCPGGYVIAAASEEGGVVTNGMSFSGRAGMNANAAILASLKPEQFPYSGPLGGMYWQRDLERSAFIYGGSSYAAPAQRLGDYMKGAASSGPGRILPTYMPGIRWGDFGQFMPPVIMGPIREAIPLFARKLKCFGEPDSVLTGPETRSSSPVRLLRGSAFQSPGVKGLYPCGEGAGWAGGIVSAAVDGLRCCEAFLQTLV